METNGPGKYDDEATIIREAHQARLVCVIVIGGSKGHGFSVQGDIPAMMGLPMLLRHTADQIENDISKNQAMSDPSQPTAE